MQSDSCSLVNVCLPNATQPRRSARRFFQRRMASALSALGPATDLEFDTL